MGVVLFDNLFSSPCLWRRPKKGQRKVTWKVTFRSIFCTISSVRFLHVFCTISCRFLHVSGCRSPACGRDFVPKRGQNLARPPAWVMSHGGRRPPLLGGKEERKEERKKKKRREGEEEKKTKNQIKKLGSPAPRGGGRSPQGPPGRAPWLVVTSLVLNTTRQGAPRGRLAERTGDFSFFSSTLCIS